MFKLIQRVKYKLPRHIKDMWYNRSFYIANQRFPEVYDSEGKYIKCAIGLKVKMCELENGKFAYYEVVKIKNSKGSDWLCQSDSIDCNLKFSHISI